MMTFRQFLETKKVNMFGLKDRTKDTSRCAKRQIGNLFKAVNPALPVAWDMGALPINSKKKKSGVMGGH